VEKAPELSLEKQLCTCMYVNCKLAHQSSLLVVCTCYTHGYSAARTHHCRNGCIGTGGRCQVHILECIHVHAIVTSVVVQFGVAACTDDGKTPPHHHHTHTHTPFPHACACRHTNQQTGQTQLSLTRARHYRRHFGTGAGVCVPCFFLRDCAGQQHLLLLTHPSGAVLPNFGWGGVGVSKFLSNASHSVYLHSGISISKRGGQWQRQRRWQRWQRAAAAGA
jgi:hypothetical protein